MSLYEIYDVSLTWMFFGSVFQTQWNIKNLICGLGFFKRILNQKVEH